MEATQAIASFNTTAPLMVPGIDTGNLVAIVLYGLLLVLTCFAAARHWWRSRNVAYRDGSESLWTVAGVFYVLAVLFICTRVAWFAVILVGHKGLTQFSVNVVADLLFFSCFSLIIIHSSENSFKTTVGETRHFSSLIARVFFAFNLVLYLFQVSLLAYINVRGQDNASTMTEVSLSVAIFDNCVCGVGFSWEEQSPA